MEQKKILWIVVAISVFVLIIFGTALLLYAPSRSSAASHEAAVTAQPTGTAQKNIDPDSWVRDPNKTPGLDSSITPNQGDINLTIVNGDNAGANYGTLDVRKLANGASGTAGDQTAPTPEGIPGQDPTAPGAKAETTTGDMKATVETTKVTTTTVTTNKGAKAPTDMKVSTAKNTTVKSAGAKTAPAKATNSKPVNVTEYWIQTGSFSSKINAEKARDTLAARYLSAEIFTKDQAGKTSFRVRVGPYKSKTEAEYWLGTITEMKDFAGSFVSEVKPKR